MRRKEGVILTEKLDAHFREKYGATFIAEGIAEGEARSEAKWKAEKIETAKNMKKKGYPVSDIIELTGLSSSEIKRLG